MENLTLSSFFDLDDYRYKDLFKDCYFVWEALRKIDEYLSFCSLGRIETKISSSSILVHPEFITIGEGTCIEEGVYIQGPCLIGKECTIRQGAYLRGNVIVGDKCIVGHASEIKHSILLNRVQAPHFNYVGDSILGNDTNLGCGFICSNYRLDGSDVKVYFNGEKIETRLKKFGIILGDGSKLGCNGVSNPGTLLGRGSKSHPSVNFGGVFAADSLIKGNSS